jgi:putative membrane protein insertion efficiency factor
LSRRAGTSSTGTGAVPMTLTDQRPSMIPGNGVDQGRAVSGAESKGTSGWSGRWLVAIVRAYQLLRNGRPTGCRFVPTCSEYAIEALEKRGTAAGVILAARRLLRCGPWGGHGFDPVPERRDACTHP